MGASLAKLEVLVLELELGLLAEIEAVEEVAGLEPAVAFLRMRMEWSTLLRVGV